MASKNDKWVMFRNYMHNELGITKEDIRMWINDAIRDEVKLVVVGTYNTCDIEEMIYRAISGVINSNYGSMSLKTKIAECIADKIQIKVL